MRGISVEALLTRGFRRRGRKVFSRRGRLGVVCGIRRLIAAWPSSAGNTSSHSVARNVPLVRNCGRSVTSVEALRTTGLVWNSR